MSINDVKWGSFNLSDIFKIESSNKGISKNKIQSLDNSKLFPYVTRTERNNGVEDFISEQDSKINDGNVIIIGSDTQTVFYQPYPFYTGNNIKILSNDYLNKFNSLFIISSLKLMLDKFNWGSNGATISRLRKNKIQLPLSKDGTPDYEYMEEFIRGVFKFKLEKYKKYIFKRKAELKYECIESLADKEWDQFYIEDLFYICPGKRLTKANMVLGDIPFIGATSLNNGITNYVSNNNESVDNNVLGVNYNGSVVDNFYHPYTCLFSDDVKRLHLKHYDDNKYVLLFFKSLILKQKEKYMYGYKFNGQRMKKQLILVPVDDEGVPDYSYMEKYIINNELRLLSLFVDFLESII